MSRLQRLLNRIEDDREDRTTLSQVPDPAVATRRNAIRRVSLTVQAVNEEPTTQPVTPDALTKLMPLQWVLLEAADLADLARAVAGLAQACWALKPDQTVSNALVREAESRTCRPQDLVAEGNRLERLLSMPWNDDLTRLARRLPPHAGIVVLDERTYASYQALVVRIVDTWHGGNQLARHLYLPR